MIQRQVGSRINSRTDGLDQKIRRFLDDLKNFKVPNPDAQKQMEQMQAGVEQVRQKHLGPAEQGLTRNEELSTGADTAPMRPSRLRLKGNNVAPKDEAKGNNETPKAQAKGNWRRRDGADQGRQRHRVRIRPREGPGTRQGKTRPKPSPAKLEGQAGESSKRTAPRSRRPGFAETRLPIPRNRARGGRDNQKAIAEELEKMLDGLSEFETYRGVVKDAQNLLKEQEQAMKQTAEAAGKPDLDGQDPRELAHPSRRPTWPTSPRGKQPRQGASGSPGRRWTRWPSGSTSRTRSPPRRCARPPRRAASKGPPPRWARRPTSSRRTRWASRSGQEQVRQDLKELVDSIQNRRERELARLVKELKNAEAELNKLRQRQAENLKKTREARNNADAKQRADQLKKLAREQAGDSEGARAAIEEAGQAQRRGRHRRPRRTSS